MTSRDFVYWLQGFAELNTAPPTEAQWTAIKNHLNLVFRHEIDPSMPDPTGELQAVHDGKVEPVAIPVAGPGKPNKPGPFPTPSDGVSPGGTLYRC